MYLSFSLFVEFGSFGDTVDGYLYILRGFRKLVIAFFSVKNTPKLINQQLKNRVKIVNWKKEVSYCFFYYQKYPYLKLKNWVKIGN